MEDQGVTIEEEKDTDPSEPTKTTFSKNVEVYQNFNLKTPEYHKIRESYQKLTQTILTKIEKDPKASIADCMKAHKAAKEYLEFESSDIYGLIERIEKLDPTVRKLLETSIMSDLNLENISVNKSEIDKEAEEMFG